MNNKNEGLKISNINKINTTVERGKLLSVLEQVFLSLDPEQLMHQYVSDILSKGNEYRNIYVIGFGKASLKMYRGIRKKTSDVAAYSGIIIPVGEEVAENFPELEILRGNHPIPSEDTLNSSRKLMSSFGDLQEDDMVLVLISGGGSALFEIPENGFTIERIGETARCLMNSGADIQELNTVRQAMSSVKGGKLAQKLYPAEVHGFIISDVPGDDPSVIASGPLTKPSRDASFLEEVYDKYQHSCKLPEKEVLLKLALGMGRQKFSHVTTKIVLKNRDYVNLMASLLEDMGEYVLTLPDPVTGDVEDVSEWFANKMRKKYALAKRPIWIIGGGETTAKVQGNGLGGRNSELSLRVAMKMQSSENFLFASLGTDGIDGVSPAMGGIGDTKLLGNASMQEIQESLSNSDSYSLLNKCNSSIITGYTGTNVSDIFVMHYGGKEEE